MERKFKSIGKQSRNKVYGHLAPFLKCRKETIMKRAKNLVLIDDKKKLDSLLQKYFFFCESKSLIYSICFFFFCRLKERIDNVMPPLLESYKVESQKVMQRK